jgi:hypothetical protein
MNFNEELNLLEYWFAKPKVEDGYLKEEIEEIEEIDLPLVDSILLSKCECMLIENEQGIVSEDNNMILRKNSIQEIKVDEDHIKIVEHDKIERALSQHEGFVNKE